jgi:hypothetical protein
MREIEIFQAQKKTMDLAVISQNKPNNVTLINYKDFLNFIKEIKTLMSVFKVLIKSILSEIGTVHRGP